MSAIMSRPQWLNTRSPLPTKAYTMLVPKFEKQPFFADFGRRKHPFFNRNRWFWGLIKPLSKAKRDFFAIYSEVPFFVKVRIYVTVSNSRHFSMYIVFFITSNLWLIIHLCITIQTCGTNKWEEIHANFYLFFFKISRFRVSHCKNTPLFFAKMGTSMVYVLGGRGVGAKYSIFSSK